MTKFKPNLITAALLTGGLSLSAIPTMAQEASADDDAQLEVIQVTGIRASLQKAQAIKMTNASIVEALSAEDIGKLPGISIAESLSRLPGLATQRLNGRASVIAIRGLSEDFSTATFNGRELVSINDNRGVEFDLFPQEIISEVVVYKSSDAALINQGIAGTIDLRSVKPLDYGEKSFVGNARYEQALLGQLNPDVDEAGFRGGFSYIDQFANDTLGVALTVNTMSSPVAEERWDAWNYSAGTVNGQDDVLRLEGMKPFVRSAELQRDSVLGVIQYAPTDNLEITLDTLYVDFEDDQRLRGVELPLFNGAGWTAEGIENVTVEDGFATSGNLVNAGALIRNDATVREAELIAIGNHIEYALNDSWVVDFDFSYSNVERTDFAFESYAGFSTPDNPGRGNTNGPRGDIAFQLLPGNEGIQITPELDFSDFNIIQAANPFDWGWDGRFLLPGAGGSQPAQWNQDGFINELEIEDELTALRLEATHSVGEGIISEVNFGVAYNEREKSRFDQGNYLTVNDPLFLSGETDFVAPQNIPEEVRLAPVSLDFLGIGEVIAYDSFALLNNGFYTQTNANFVDTGRPRGSWTVSEEVMMLFAKATIDTDVVGLPLTGNIGFQYQDVSQESTGFVPGFRGEDNQFPWLPNSGGTDYAEFLPSLNLNLEVADGHMVRFAASRTLTRSRMDRMNASFSTNFDVQNITSTDINSSPWSGGGGNPALEPIVADGLDLAYEWYFADTGYIAIAGFYRDLNNWQAESQTLTDFSSVDLTELSEATGVPVGDIQTQGFVNVWQNTEGGDISGIEVSGTIPFEIIGESLAGFGLQFSATFLDGEIQLPGSDEPEDIPGQSERLFTGSFYYEKSGFQARLSYRYRDDFLAEVSGISLTRVTRTGKAEGILDAQLGYDFSDSSIEALQGLTVQLQMQNITDEPFVTFNNGDERQIKDFQRYGRTLLAGLIYKF